MDSFLKAHSEDKQWQTTMSINYLAGSMTGCAMPFGQTLNQISTELPSIDLIAKLADKEEGAKTQPEVSSVIFNNI